MFKSRTPTISKAILKILEYGAVTTIDIAWAFSAGKKESLRRFHAINYSQFETPGKRAVREFKLERLEYKKYHTLLSKLKADGLIVVNKVDGHKSWKLSALGRMWLKRLGQESATIEAMTKPGGLTIVSYDIPESRRITRGQLRDLLRMLEFTQLQQSLWYGNKKLTEEFMKMLKAKHILDCVHIFEVGKTGTLLMR